jgi:hypothetical protein
MGQNKLGETVKMQIERNLREHPMWDGVWNHISDQVLDQVGNLVGGQGVNQVWYYVREQLSGK